MPRCERWSKALARLATLADALLSFLLLHVSAEEVRRVWSSRTPLHCFARVITSISRVVQADPGMRKGLPGWLLLVCHAHF